MNGDGDDVIETRKRVAERIWLRTAHAVEGGQDHMAELLQLMTAG